MSPFPRAFLPMFYAVAVLNGQTTPPSVGSGVAPVIQTRFQIAFLRGAFSALVLQPPIADVHKFGNTGLVQEFYNLAKTERGALVLADQTKIGFPNDVVQVYPDMYTYYTTVGVNTAGYPTQDTQSCPGVALCTYQLFTNNYALFVMPSGNPNGTQFAVSGNFFVKWTAFNGIAGPLGVVTNSQQTLTSSSKTTANFQDFAGGTLFSITSGTNNGQTFSVIGATDTLYQSLGGAAGLLGLPLGDEQALAGGVQRQLFEGGRIQYPTGGTPVLLLPVSEIQVSPQGPLSLKSGQTVTLTETAYDTAGALAAGRAVSWSSTNGQVVSIQAKGNSAVLKSLGSGTALVTAASEGKVSTPILVTVSAPCCSVGEGAPSVTIGQLFQDAVTRNRLVVMVPGPNPVRAVSNGFIQDLVSADGKTHFLIATNGQTGSAYLIAGAQLAAFLQAGGPAGSLGFPVTDSSAGGTQLFEHGALGGSPPQSVSGAVLSKWATLKYESGIAGVPVMTASSFLSRSGFGGQAQQFTNGVIYGIATGSRSGQGFYASGAILTRYMALGGPAGALGLPVTDPYNLSGVQRQNFENGYIDLQPGAATAVNHLIPRAPAVTANPASALPGSRLHLSVSGFADGATLRISVAGRPDFTVTTQNGSYEWDLYIDTAAATATVAIHAVDLGTGATADGGYSVRTVADARPNLTKVAGDNQTGLPGSVLPVQLAVTLRDGTGVPLAGVAVNFSTSPGSQVTPAQSLTDLNGSAATVLRLPPTAGLAAVTASSLGKIAIFNARTAGSAPVTAFPQFLQTSGVGNIGNGTDTIADKGSLLTAAAAVVRFYQNQGLVATPNGLADPNTLNRYLAGYCAPGTQVCDGFVANPGSEQVVNLWRVGAFVGGGLVPSVEDPSIAAVRSLVATGSPVILNLALQQDGVPAGETAAVVTGVNADSSLQISDPNPALGRTALTDYLSGFSAAGHVWQASVLSAVRLLPGQPSPTGFVLGSVSQTLAALPGLDAQSAAGSCGRSLQLENSVAVSPGPPANLQGSTFLYCDGTQPLYLASFTAAGPFSGFVTDLAPGGASRVVTAAISAGYQITRAPAFTVSAPSANFTAGAVVNAASFRQLVAPGEIVSLFGSALSGPGTTTQVTVDGAAATVLAATPFQLNVVMPLTTVPGNVNLTVNSAYGSSTQSVAVTADAPGIFVLSTYSDGTAQGAIVNSTGAVNSFTAPALRGETVVVYGTGLGAVSSTAPLTATAVPVAAVLAGAELPVSYAGLAPGFVGLYQVNVPIPAGTPPGLSLSFALRQGGQDSNSVNIAIQ